MILKDILIMNLKNDYSVEIQMNDEPKMFYPSTGSSVGRDAY